jgi:hypothetical protein
MPARFADALPSSYLQTSSWLPLRTRTARYRPSQRIGPCFGGFGLNLKLRIAGAPTGNQPGFRDEPKR